MAEVHPKWRTPAFALIGQAVWAGILTHSGRYDQLYTYVMFGMVLLSICASRDWIVHPRWKHPESAGLSLRAIRGWPCDLHRSWDTAWTLNTLSLGPKEALAGTIIVLIGVPGYLYWKWSGKAAAVE